MSSPLSLTDSIVHTTQHEQSSPSSDYCTDDAMPTITDVQSINLFKSSKRPNSVSTTLINYGPIRVRKRQTSAPTLATGRRSKDDHVEGEDLLKRNIRRMKNRESARNLKKIRDDIQQSLQTELQHLEFEEHKLSSQVKTLQIYKQYLEEQCRRHYPIYEIITRTAAAILTEFKKQQKQMQIKEEPRSSSPERQILFST